MNSELKMFHRILQAAVEGNASDAHLKAGVPVLFRLNRELVPVECPVPDEAWMNSVVGQAVPAHLKTRLEEEHGVDFSYFVQGIGRFRTNVFKQRGQWSFAMRYVKTQAPSFDELGLSEQIRRIAEAPRGIVLVGGTTGSGKSTTLAAMIEHNSSFQ